MPSYMMPNNDIPTDPNLKVGSLEETVSFAKKRSKEKGMVMFVKPAPSIKHGDEARYMATDYNKMADSVIIYKDGRVQQKMKGFFEQTNIDLRKV